MAYIRKKGRKYYFVKSQRDGSRVRQKVLAYLGEYPSADEAIAGFQREIESLKSLEDGMNESISEYAGKTGDCLMQKHSLSSLASFFEGGKFRRPKRWTTFEALKRKALHELRITSGKIKAKQKTIDVLKTFKSK
jgi:hypothetical protein